VHFGQNTQIRTAIRMGSSMHASPAARMLLPLIVVAAVPACAPRGVAEPPAPRAGEVYQEGVASWYGPGFDGRTTANGEAFDAAAFTAAHRRLPFDSRVRVINLENGLEVVVRINDRGPFVDDRVIDVSQAAARALGMIEAGIARVRLVLEGG
jgi:rare lipoprotein A